MLKEIYFRGRALVSEIEDVVQQLYRRNRRWARSPVERALDIYALEDRVLYDIAMLPAAVQIVDSGAAGTVSETVQTATVTTASTPTTATPASSNTQASTNSQQISEAADASAESAPSNSTKDAASSSSTTEVADQTVSTSEKSADSKVDEVRHVNFVLIDDSLNDIDKLIKSLGSDTEYYVFDHNTQSAADVLKAVTEWSSANNAQIDSLSILSHGVSGSFQLGDQWISESNLSTSASAWQELGKVLSADASVNIFSCNVAATTDGQALINDVAKLTGATTYASTDYTGYGGDWVLEASSTGAAASSWQNPLDTSALADWKGELDTIHTVFVTTTSDSCDATLIWGSGMTISQLNSNAGADGVVSLREAVIAANNTLNSGGADHIYFNIAGAGVQTISLTSSLTVSDAVIIDGYSQSGASVNTLDVGDNAVLKIQINGASAGAVSGLTLNSAADGSTIRGLAITGFAQAGIYVSAGSDYNVIEGNFIGLNAAGTSAVANGWGVYVGGDYNLIGGATAAARNVISGNTTAGVMLDSVSGNSIVGNYIGTNAAGTTAVANGYGVYCNNVSSTTVGGSTSASRNVISGNTTAGILFNASVSGGNLIQGNYVGVNASDSAGLANGVGVTVIESAGLTIGGTTTGQGNVIASNGGVGVSVSGGLSSSVRILGNSIYSNGGLGIDLGADGVTTNDANDVDSGANSLQNYPVITSAILNGTSLTLSGSVNSSANTTYRIEVFSSTSADSTGYGEGQTYLGYFEVTTDASGNANFSQALTVSGVSQGNFVSVTATNKSTLNTSEFSSAVGVPGLTISSSSISTTEGGGTATFSVSLKTRPTSDVTITLTPSVSGLGSLSATTLTFTASNWNTAQTVTVTGLNDTLVANVGYSIDLSIASSDVSYNGLTVTGVSATNTNVGDTYNTIYVDTTSDTLDGDTSSLAALYSNRGSDGKISLREAITAANNTTNGSGGADRIYFNLTSGSIISVASQLPDISTSMVIDATNGAGTGTPLIELYGLANTVGLNITGDSSTIRGLAICNFGYEGVLISGNSNTVVGCYIGTDLTGTTAVANGYSAWCNAVLISGNYNTIGGSTAADRNVIAGNGHGGVWMDGSHNTVSGNYVGLNKTGETVLRNAGMGIGTNTTATYNTISGNVVAGNGYYTDGWGIYAGVEVHGAYTTVSNNIIGLTASGVVVSWTGGSTTYYGNAYDGISLYSSNVTISGNTISGNSRYGVFFGDSSSTYNTISGNYIGTTAASASGVGNKSDGVYLVGGYHTVSNNVISGNTGYGIEMVSVTYSTVQGNLIGTNVAGTAAIANGQHGIYLATSSYNTIGGTTAAARNVLSGNTYNGLYVYGSANNTIQGNYIGTDVTGTLAVANGWNGVAVRGYANDAINNLIGGTAAGAGNVIAFNTYSGVAIDIAGNTGNAILGNSIYSNGNLGIDLTNGVINSGDGITANDAGDSDVGGNNYQNYPSLTSVTSTGTTVRVIGSLSTAASTTYRVEFFASASADASGYGEGKRYLGYATVTTDASGAATINASLTASVAEGEVISATATNLTTNDTSEFSAVVTAHVPQIVITSTGPLVTSEGGGSCKFNVSLNAAPSADVVVKILSKDTGEGTVSVSTLTFTSSNWNVAQEVTVTGVDDSLGDGDVAFTVQASIVTASSATEYAAVSSQNVTVTNSDNEAPGITVTPVGGSTTTESGGQATYAVVLNCAPEADVKVNLVSSNVLAGTVSVSSLTFTASNWNVAQYFTVTGVNDYIIGDVSYTVTLSIDSSSASGYLSALAQTVSLTNTNNDTYNTIFVDTTSDAIDGTTTSIAALYSNKGTDGKISLREAITAANNSANGSGGADRIYFNLAAGSTINVTAQYNISTAMIIDANSGSGATTPSITLKGAANIIGFNVTSSGTSSSDAGSVIRGFAVNNFGYEAFLITGNYNTVADCYIGTDLTGTTAVMNGYSGWRHTIQINGNFNTIGGSTVADRNVISGNKNWAVLLTGDDNTITGNYIGVNPTGNVKLANGGAGIEVQSSSDRTLISNNVISGNGDHSNGSDYNAVVIAGTYSVITNNIIGRGADRTTVIGNILNGVWATGANTTITNNLIANNTVAGVYVTGGYATITGNTISNNSNHGVNLGGSYATISNNTITGNTNDGIFATVGYATISGNVLSGNTMYGLDLRVGANNNTITGNFIGTNATGTAAYANGQHGVVVYGSSNNTISGNVISGNTYCGVYVSTVGTSVAAQNNTFTGNYIGTDVTGTSAIANGRDGIGFRYGSGTLAGNMIGGTNAGSANVIAYNTHCGVRIDYVGANGISILGNSIFSNGLLAINLTTTNSVGDATVNVNDTGDADTGANNGQNFPVITAATINGSQIYLAGTLNTNANGTYRIEFYANAAADSSGYGEGKRYLGYLEVTTDASGNASFASDVAATVADGEIISATATKYTKAGSVYTYSDTSEFSACLAAHTPGVVVSQTSGLITSEYLSSASFTVVLKAAPTANVTIAVSSSDTTEGTVSTSLLTFTTSNWNVAQTVTITGVDDALEDGTVSYTIVTDAASSSDVLYNGMAVSDVTVKNMDNDSAGATVIALDNLTTAENGGTATFQVVLNKAPTADVVLNVASSNTLIGTVNKSSLTFTSANWNVAQTVTVTGVNNSVCGDLSYSISITADAARSATEYADIYVPTLAVTNVNDDTFNTIYVDTTSDTLDGDTSSLSALYFNRGSDGKISLREAITAANNTTNGSGGADRIYFNLTSGSIITLASQLPNISTSMIIDATNGAGTGTPLIELYGLANTVGLSITGDSSTIRGLAICNFGNEGVLISGNYNTVAACYIGTDLTGTTTVANGYSAWCCGVNFTGSYNTFGGTTAADRNIVAGNGHGGVWLEGSHNTVAGNYVGLDKTGETVLRNAGMGIGTGSAATYNTISGNVVTGNGYYASGWGIYYGIELDGGYTTVSNNIVGLTASGKTVNWVVGSTTYYGNANDGIGALSSYNTITGNVVSGNSRYGMNVTGTYNVIQGNIVGLGMDGATAAGNKQHGIYVSGANNTIGGTTAPQRNVISGNAYNGINVASGGNYTTIVGNYVGLAANGVTAVGNGYSGVALYSTNNTVGGTTAGARNVVSGNLNAGVWVQGTNNAIQGNYVGTDYTGTVAVGNSWCGITVFASNNAIGGTVAGAGNLVAYNSLVGVEINNNSSGNSILGNSIFGNSKLGIDLAYNGVTANDAGDTDSGPNAYQNFPILSGARLIGCKLEVYGSFNSTASTTYRVELFASASADATGYGQGQRYLGFLTVTTDASGNATFAASLTASVADGEVISATATNLTTNNTSEFSKTVTAYTPGVVITASGAYVTSEYGTSASFNVVLHAIPTSDVTIAIASSDTSEGTVSKTLLTFTTSNWNVAQKVTVTGAGDYLSDGDISYQIVVSPSVSSDSAYSSIGGASLAFVNTDRVNSAPTISAPSNQTAGSDALIFSSANGNGITVDDVDAGPSLIRVRLNVLNGNITLSPTAHVTFIQGHGAHDVVVEFIGSVDEVNEALEGMKFNAAQNSTNSDVAKLAIFVSDEGNSGSGGVKTSESQVNINVVTQDRLQHTLNLTTTPIAPTATVTANWTAPAIPVSANPSLGLLNSQEGMHVRNLRNDSLQKANDANAFRNVGSAGAVTVDVSMASTTSAHDQNQFVVAQTSLIPRALDVKPIVQTTAVDQQILLKQIALSAETSNSLSWLNGLSVGATIGVGAGLSAGYMMLAFRFGALLTGSLITFPMWQWIDPLPILENAAAGAMKKRKPVTAEERSADAKVESLESLLT